MRRQGDAAEVWRERIGAQRASGQSIPAWCQANGCQEQSFYWWRTRLGLQPKGRQLSAAGIPSNRIMFTEVVANPANRVAESIRLRLGSDRELLLPASLPMEQIAKLVRAIEGLA